MDNKSKVIEMLLGDGWSESGYTPIKSYRTTSFAFPGHIVTLGGRQRLRNGKWTVTVGKITTVFSLKPDNPERVGKGGLFTYNDWEQYAIPTKELHKIEERIKIINEVKTDGNAKRD